MTKYNNISDEQVEAVLLDAKEKDIHSVFITSCGINRNGNIYYIWLEDPEMYHNWHGDEGWKEEIIDL